MTEQNLRMHLLRTSHLGPSLLVTLVGFLLANSSGSAWSALGIALTIFTGQLCIGWTNDLVDLESDRSQARKNKPLANGTISVRTVQIATVVALTVCVVLSPLPYIIAFGAFPSAIALSKNHAVSIWLITLGALFGIAAHFANVVKDMAQDRDAGLRGLPQRLDTRSSLLVAGTALLAISIILATHTHLWIPVPMPSYWSAAFLSKD